MPAPTETARCSALSSRVKSTTRKRRFLPSGAAHQTGTGSPGISQPPARRRACAGRRAAALRAPHFRDPIRDGDVTNNVTNYPYAQAPSRAAGRPQPKHSDAVDEAGETP